MKNKNHGINFIVVISLQTSSQLWCDYKSYPMFFVLHFNLVNYITKCAQ